MPNGKVRNHSISQVLQNKGETEMEFRRQILLVEPDRELRHGLKRMLKQSGYRIVTAGDGRDALDILSETECDLVITALRMPNLDGIELMAELNRARIHAPVIFLTAYGDVESYMDVMNMGAYDYLNKPVKSEEIVNIVRKALGHVDRALFGSDSPRAGSVR